MLFVFGSGSGSGRGLGYRFFYSGVKLKDLKNIFRRFWGYFGRYKIVFLGVFLLIIISLFILIVLLFLI